MSEDGKKVHCKITEDSIIAHKMHADLIVLRNGMLYMNQKNIELTEETDDYILRFRVEVIEEKKAKQAIKAD